MSVPVFTRSPPAASPERQPWLRPSPSISSDASPVISTAAAPRSPLLPGARAEPIYVLDRIVGVVAKPGKEWWEIPSASKKAYGVDKNMNMQEVVEGLTLYARLGDSPLLTSSLAIRMSADVRRMFESKLGLTDPDDPIGSDDLRAQAVVEMAEQGLTTIVLSFSRLSLSLRLQRPLSYYLVYDATDRSLSMFQIPPGEGFCTRKPVIPKRTRCGDHELFLLGRQVSLPSHEGVSFWVSSLSASYGTAVSSKFKRMDFPAGEIHKPFKVDVAFYFKGKAFWGDLRQGLMYCDLQTKDFGFVKLPCKCKCKIDEETGEPLQPITSTRTLGCDRDNIWFVCIDTPSHYSTAVVGIWRLDFSEEQLEGESKEVEWTSFDKLTAKMLWELHSFKMSGLPALPFQYPILTGDGALCFVLVDQSRFPRNKYPLVDHFCSFDMHYKRLQWHGLVHNYPITHSIVMYPSSDFLQMKQSPCNMSLVGGRADAGLKAMPGVAAAGGCADSGLKAMAGVEDRTDAGLKAMAGGVRQVVQLFETMAGGPSCQAIVKEHGERH